MLHWALDATPQNMQFTDRNVLWELDSHGLPPDRSTREVLVQRGRICVGNTSQPIFVRPLVLGDETSATLLDAVMAQMESSGVDLKVLSRSFRRVVIHFGLDGAATCELVVDYILVLLQGLPNVTPLFDFCCMHPTSAWFW